MTQFKTALAANVKLNLLSCVVGLGPVGDKFATGLGALLSSSEQAELRSSLFFGLGDWSMPEGMGFWDYITDEQLAKDNAIYPVNRRDRDIMMAGKVRVAAIKKGGWQSTVLEDQDFMGLETENLDTSRAKFGVEKFPVGLKAPESIRIPGTGVYEVVN